MSKYRDYAKKLNAAFAKASESMREAYEAFQEAASAREEGVDTSTPERYPGQHEAEKVRLDAAYNEAQAALKKTQRAAWNEFSQTRDRLGKDLEAAVESDRLVNPDEIDDNAVKLLQSGIMSADDFQNLYNKYSGNITMQRLIGGEAQKAADALANDTNSEAAEDRRTLTAIAYDSRNVKPAVLEDWDNLCSAAGHYSGETSGDTDPGYILKMNGRWTDDNVQEAINDF